MTTIFTKIINKEIPAHIVYEDDLALAFHDIAPKAKVHVLIIPKKPLERVSDATEVDQALLGHLLLVCNRVAEKLNVSASGYRLITNNGKDAGQEVDHLHIHLLAGETLGPHLSGN